MADQPPFTYGGQAVIEGVMIRGRSHFSLAVRRPDGSITTLQEPLNSIFTGRVRQVPLVRGVLILAETLLLGIRALNYSSRLAMESEPGEVGENQSKWALGVTLAISLALGVGIFFVLPLLLVRLIDPFLASDIASNTIEGLIRLAILLGYVWGIGFLGDIKRVYAYHGAEHMAVHAYEARLPLTPQNVRRFGTPHPRCGTAFLLTVVVVSIIAFAFLGRPDLEWRILSRIALLPVIASVSYELIRFSGRYQDRWIGRQIAKPGLLLQRLTTRRPDDDQIEVAIAAMSNAIAADKGEGRPAAITSEATGEASGSAQRREADPTSG